MTQPTGWVIAFPGASMRSFLLLSCCAWSGVTLVAAEPEPTIESIPSTGTAVVPLRPRPEVGWNRDFVLGIPGDLVDVASMPAHWDRRDWLTAAAVVGAGVGIYAMDNSLDRHFQAWRSDGSNRLAKLVKPFGREYALIGLAGTAAVSPFIDDRRVIRTALLGVESLLVSGAAYVGLQSLANRSRPAEGVNRDEFSGPGFGGGHHSFPSGHTTTAFALATVVAHEWRDIPAVPYLAYGIAGLVGWSRLNDHAHWSSDVYAGAIIGWASATAIEALHRPGDRVTVTPVISPKAGAVAVALKF